MLLLGVIKITPPPTVCGNLLSNLHEQLTCFDYKNCDAIIDIVVTRYRFENRQLHMGFVGEHICYYLPRRKVPVSRWIKFTVQCGDSPLSLSFVPLFVPRRIALNKFNSKCRVPDLFHGVLQPNFVCDCCIIHAFYKTCSCHPWFNNSHKFR
jgi:hypothetical protein